MSTEPSNSNEETKKCPYCAEIIKAEAIKCRYCGSDLTVTPPAFSSQPNSSVPPVQQPTTRQNASSDSDYNYIPHPQQLERDTPHYTSISFTLIYAFSIILGLLSLFAIGMSIRANDILKNHPSYYLPTTEEAHHYIDSGFRDYKNAKEDFLKAEVVVSKIVFIASLSLSLILLLRLLYCCWNVIQDGYAHTTPEKAVFLLFIPFFHIYWLFVAFFCLASDMNKHIVRNELNVEPCSKGLVLFSCIMNLITAVLFFLHPLFILINFFIAPFALYSLMRTARDIQRTLNAQDYCPIPDVVDNPNSNEKPSTINNPMAFYSMSGYDKRYHDNSDANDNPNASAEQQSTRKEPLDVTPHLTIIVWLIVFMAGIAHPFGFLGLAWLCISFSMLLYYCWEAVQDGWYASTTPRKAVEYMFIPLFNIYWFFSNLLNLCEDLNDYISRYKLNIIPCNRRLVLSSLIVWLCNRIICLIILLHSIGMFSLLTLPVSACLFAISPTMIFGVRNLMYSGYSTLSIFINLLGIIELVLIALTLISMMRAARDIKKFKMEQMNKTEDQ